MTPQNYVGVRSEPISRMTANIRYPTAKSGGESSGILPSISDYVRYAANGIKMKGIVTFRIAYVYTVPAENK